MLKILKLEELPQKVKELIEINQIQSIESIYSCEGMFGYKHTDYLIVIAEEIIEEDGSITCYGYVYNGACPEFSEFGQFGLNKERTERVW